MAKQPSANRPERKFGPYAGHPGLGAAVWLNTLATDQGPKQTRSITISSRRYRDKSGQWQDANSFWVGDLPVLILALQQALEYCLTTPIPGEEARDGSGTACVPPTRGLPETPRSLRLAPGVRRRHH